MSTQNGIPRPQSRLRGLLALALCVCLGLSLLPAPAQAADPTGSWTDANNYNIGWYEKDTEALTYTISTAEELAGLAVLVNGGTSDFTGKTIVLSADIDLSAHAWVSIGADYTHTFKGVFDGAGHTISNVTQTLTAMPDMYDLYGGLFGYVYGGQISRVRLRNLSIKASADKFRLKVGAVVGDLTLGTLTDCVSTDCTISGSITASSGTEYACYVGGLVGEAQLSSVQNSVVTNFQGSVSVAGSTDGSRAGVAGIGATTSAENCFVSGLTLETKLSTTDQGTDGITLAYLACSPYGIEVSVSDCYYVPSGLTEKGAVKKTRCYEVTTEQAAGTSDTLIDPSGSYAQTPNVAQALNNWVAAQGTGSYITWKTVGGVPIPSIFAPKMIDIGAPGADIRHEDRNAVDAPLTLEGQAYKGVTLLSVTLPVDVPFVMEADGAGKLVRLLSATGTITNRSDCAVDVTLDSVVDGADLLGKVDLFLAPEPAPPSERVALKPGTGQTDLLASLAAPGAGADASAKLRVEGQAKTGGAPLGVDGEEYLVALILKVTKSP